MKVVHFLFILFIINSCSTLSEKEKILIKINKLKVTKISFWKDWKTNKLTDKVYPKAPVEIIEYLNLMNQRDHFTEKPRLVVIDKSWQKDIKKALSSLPSKIRLMINQNIKAIFFVKDLGGSAIVLGLRDKNGIEISGIAIFDINSINKKANDWCTWKENTPFLANSNYSLKCILETDKNNTRSQGFQYIFLHEMGHIILKKMKLDFPWDKFAKSQEEIDQYLFSKLSWRFVGEFTGTVKDYILTSFESVFPQRIDIKYYQKQPSFSLLKAAIIYKNLKKTNFSTLYGSLNPNDDVADSFANYVHTKLLKKPFNIIIYKNGQIIEEYQSCWSERRCLKKRLILDKIFL